MSRKNSQLRNAAALIALAFTLLVLGTFSHSPTAIQGWVSEDGALYHFTEWEQARKEFQNNPVSTALYGCSVISIGIAGIILTRFLWHLRCRRGERN
jgi:hypothetical protein